MNIRWSNYILWNNFTNKQYQLYICKWDEGSSSSQLRQIHFIVYVYRIWLILNEMWMEWKKCIRILHLHQFPQQLCHRTKNMYKLCGCKKKEGKYLNQRKCTRIPSEFQWIRLRVRWGKRRSLGNDEIIESISWSIVDFSSYFFTISFIDIR